MAPEVLRNEPSDEKYVMISKLGQHLTWLWILPSKCFFSSLKSPKLNVHFLMPLFWIHLGLMCTAMGLYCGSLPLRRSHGIISTRCRYCFHLENIRTFYPRKKKRKKEKKKKPLFKFLCKVNIVFRVYSSLLYLWKNLFSRDQTVVTN